MLRAMCSNAKYVFLILVVLVSLFPLYWSLVVASHDNSAVAAYPPAC